MKNIIKYVSPVVLLLVVDFGFGPLKEIIPTQLMIAIGYVYYLHIGTDNKYLLIPLSASAAMLPIIEFLVTETTLFPSDFGYAFILPFAIVTGILYFKRFWQKEDKRDIISVIKLLAVFQLCIVYVIDLNLVEASNFIVGLVYASTRIFEREFFTLINAKIIIGVIILFSVFFIVLAQIQASNAVKELSKSKQKEEYMMGNFKLLEYKVDSLKGALEHCQSEE